MINKMLIKQPITDGNSKNNSVRIPNMENWSESEQTKTLATEDYVDLAAASTASAVTTLYSHSWFGGLFINLSWISCNPNVISKSYDVYDQAHSLFYDLGRAVSIVYQSGIHMYPVIAFTCDSGHVLIWIIDNLTTGTFRPTQIDITASYEPESSAPAVYNAATMWPS